jgi:plastocyanin
MKAKLLKFAAVGISLACVVAPSSAGAQSPPKQQAVSGPGGQFYGYLTPVVVVQKKGKLAYSNVDIVQHDFVHDAKADRVYGTNRKPWCDGFPRNKCPVFWSKRAGLGQTVPVKGLGSVKKGKTYTFYCTLHPSMVGDLVVAP